MAWMSYTCPICNKVVLDTSQFDSNCADILLNHLKSWHQNEINKKITTTKENNE